jgi:hypothetical protein
MESKRLESEVGAELTRLHDSFRCSVDLSERERLLIMIEKLNALLLKPVVIVPSNSGVPYVG